MEKKINTRYAPSPTGNFHVGGARTALFNYLISKKTDGKFILRIDDTDVKRNIIEKDKIQFKYLKWLGIEPDFSSFENLSKNEVSFRQSERIDIYLKYINVLLEKGQAYKCFLSKEEIDKEKGNQLANNIKSPRLKDFYRANIGKRTTGEYTIRLKTPENINYSWKDKIRGNIEINSSDLDDWVILKSNGIPTYNFATVIDDYLMKITHVLRGGRTHNKYK